jgi:hypothetical protein
MLEEIVVALPATRDRIPVCTHVRSTLISSSILALKRHGVFARYESHLPPERRDAILYAVAGQWLPIADGIAHYTACDAMELPTEEMIALGASVASIAERTMFSFVLRLATESGVTPWTMLAKSPAHWGRSYKGSAVALHKLGPKEARVEVVAQPLAAIGYWRSALQGIGTAAVQAFSTRAFVRELPRRNTTPFDVSYRISWA